MWSLLLLHVAPSTLWRIVPEEASAQRQDWSEAEKELRCFYFKWIIQLISDRVTEGVRQFLGLFYHEQ